MLATLPPRLLRSSLALALLFLITGCPDQPDPDPMDTFVGPGGENVSPNFIQGSDVFGEPIRGQQLRDEGLSERTISVADAGFGGNGSAAQPQAGILPSVYFGFDQSSVAPAERAKLNEAYRYLRQNPNTSLIVEGHCDWRGTTAYNMALGDRRAASVRDFLVTLGIDPARISVLSKGDLEATPNLSKEASAQDRRADLLVVRR